MQLHLEGLRHAGAIREVRQLIVHQARVAQAQAESFRHLALCRLKILEKLSALV
jgi:hypothetical protein